MDVLFNTIENGIFKKVVALCVCNNLQVKRKEPPEAASSGDQKRIRPSTPLDDDDEGWCCSNTFRLLSYIAIYKFTNTNLAAF